MDRPDTEEGRERGGEEERENYLGIPRTEKNLSIVISCILQLHFFLQRFPWKKRAPKLCQKSKKKTQFLNFTLFVTDDGVEDW